MRTQKYSKWIILPMVTIITMVMGLAVSENWAAEKYPNRLIQIVIAFTPGTTDMALRPFTDKFPEYLGQPAAYVFKPGAAGAVGASFVAKAKPDGYTLIGTTPSPVMICPLTKEVDYTLDDFTPICRLVASPLILVVEGNSPLKTLKDIVDEARKFPGKLAYTTAGVFSMPHIPMEIFAKLAGINLNHIPVEGCAPGSKALLGGHVSMNVCPLPSLSSYIKSGLNRPIAVFEKERWKEFPNVPTFSELGYPVVFPTWFGFLAPKGTPVEVVKTIHMALKKIIDDHKNSIEDQLGKMGVGLYFQGPEEFANELKAENKIIKEAVKDLMKSIK